MVKQLNKDGTINMTQAEFNKVHTDYKSSPGRPLSVLQYDTKNGGAALYYVNIINKV